MDWSCRCGFFDEGKNAGKEILRVERLLNEIRRAKVKAALLIFNGGMPGNKHNRGLFQVGDLLQMHEQVESVTVGHFNVKGDQVERFRLSQTQGFLGIQSRLRFATGSRQ